MIVYIEGVDGSGKTTLKAAIKEKLEQLNYTVNDIDELAMLTHPDNPNRVNSSFSLILTMINMINSKTVYLCDRGPLSDIIYRTFDEHKPVISFRQLMYVRNNTNRSRFIIVLCDTDKSEQLMLARGDNNPVAISRHKEIRYLYQQFASILDVKKYDLSTSDPVWFVNYITSLLPISIKE